mgnify:CR=1 FL=1
MAPLLQVDNIEVYYGVIKALKGISFEVNKGEIVALIGANGAGKSTTIKMMCGIQAELNYSQRGWNEKIEDGSENTYSRTMNYIEVPLLAHLAFGKDALDKGAKFFINMGPQVAFFLNEKEKMSEDWNPAYRPNGVNQQYGKWVENKFDYGLLGGLGMELSTKAGHFLLEGRYYYGLADFWGSTKKDEFGRSGHSYMGVKLTYLFDITK